MIIKAAALQDPNKYKQGRSLFTEHPVPKQRVTVASNKERNFKILSAARLKQVRVVEENGLDLLSDAELRRINFSVQRLNDWHNWSNRDLRGIIFSSSTGRSIFGKGINFTGANLDEANFSGVPSVGDSIFVNASLRGAKFYGCCLSGVSFEGADLEGADFSGAIVNPLGAVNKETNFKRTVWTGALLAIPEKDLAIIDLSSCIGLENADVRLN